MHRYLDAHPDISVLTKELHFFGSDIRYLKQRGTCETMPKELAQLPNTKWHGESAVWYLKSKDAIQALFEYNPQMKIIAQFRNPTEACYSMWSNMHYNGNEPLDFEAALNAEPQRKDGHLPAQYTCPSLAYTYRETFLYSQQVERLLSIFPKEQIQFVFFDELRHHPAKIFKETLELIGAATNFQPKFVVHNSNKSVKSTRLRKFILSPNPRVKKMVKGVLPNKSTREKIKQQLTAINTSHTQRPPIPPHLEKDLNAYFRPDIERLEKRLNKDLSHWKGE